MILHYIICHYDKDGHLVLNDDLLSKLPQSSMVLVINNISRAKDLDPSDLDYGVRKVITLDIDSISKVRNKVIEDFLNSDATHMTMIDGDDDISDRYHEFLEKFSINVDTIGIFGGTWVNPIGLRQHILNYMDSSKLLKYAVHYTNWLYLYSREFLKSLPTHYPDWDGYSFAEDEFFYARIRHLFPDRVPVLCEDLYIYREANSEVAKMDDEESDRVTSYFNLEYPKNYEEFIHDGRGKIVPKYILTIVIPTVGRTTLIDTLLSIFHPSLSSRVKVIVSYNSQKDLNNQSQDLLEMITQLNAKVVVNEFEEGVGANKLTGMRKVDTKYLMVLDDDDGLNGLALKRIIIALDRVNPTWISFNWSDERIDPIGIPQVIHMNKQLVLDKIFDYDKYSEESYKYLYPNSSMVVDTKVALAEIDKMSVKYSALTYGEDILLMSSICLNYPGLLIEGQLLYSGSTLSGVSRRVPIKEEVQPLIDELYYRVVNSEKDESRYWIRIMSNLFKRINYVKLASEKK